LTAHFYYPATVTGAAEAALVLLYFDGTGWLPVGNGGVAAPLKNTTDNLDGTLSGGRFTVTFDAGSVPSILDLTGTPFAIALDSTPPTLHCPANMVREVAANESAVQVNFNLTASDNSGSVQVIAEPPSGSQFPLGVSTVNCVATDPSGRSSRCSFTVTVLPPANQPPLAALASFSRNPGLPLRIAIADLLANYTSDADGDARTLFAVRAGTNGATISTDADFLSYEPSETHPHRNTTDHFRYEVTDGRGGFATNFVRVTVNGGGGGGGGSGANLAGIDTVGAQKRIRFHGIPGFAYRVQRAEVLNGDSTVWTDLPGTATEVTPGAYEYLDTSPPSGTAYYRTVWP
jgi:hypothetical protein